MLFNSTGKVRNLFLIRHAKSSWDNPTLRDFERSLNERGLDIAPKMAAFMKSAGITPDLIVSSPAKRAIDTARFFAIRYNIPEEKILQIKEIYEATPMEVERIISNLPPEANTVFMFGHNPTFTEVANRFTDDLIFNLPTCGIVQIESSAPDWRSMYEGNSKVVGRWFPKLVL